MEVEGGGGGGGRGGKGKVEVQGELWGGVSGEGRVDGWL